jgi:hypothetical protein
MMLRLPEHNRTKDSFHSADKAALPLHGKDRDVLNRLRLCAMECRVAARVDLFEACALLTLEGEDAKRRFMDTFVRCLSDAFHRPVKWYHPGAQEVTFDEAWVLRCLSSIEAGDADSLSFLLRSRVARENRRYIGYLLGRISEQFRLD